MITPRFLRPALLYVALLCSACVVEPAGYDDGGPGGYAGGPAPAAYYGSPGYYYPGYAAYPWDTGVAVDIGAGYGHGWYGGRGGYRGGYGRGGGGRGGGGRGGGGHGGGGHH